MRFWRHHLPLLTRTALLLILVAVCWPTGSRVLQWWDPVQAAQQMELCTSVTPQAQVSSPGQGQDLGSPHAMQGAEHCLSGCCWLSLGLGGGPMAEASKPTFAPASADTRPEAAWPMAYWVSGLWPPTVPQPPPFTV